MTYKFIRNGAISISALALLLFGIIKLNNQSKSADLLPGPNPGYMEQYRIMKQNEAGELPLGLRNFWYNHDSRNYKKATNLLAIKELGPDHVGGRTRALLIDKDDNNKIIAGAISGGIWMSLDRGTTWKMKDDHALSLAVTRITQNPFNGNEIYYGTGESLGNSAGIDGNGIFKSVDGGETFEQLTSTNNSNFVQNWDIKHSLTDSQTVYAATNDKGLWKSTDGGFSFSKIYSTSRKIHEIEVFNDSTVMFTVAGLGVYTFKEGVENISKINGGLPSTGAFDRISIAYCESQPNVIYAQYMGSSSTSHFGFYKTTNGGTSWVSLSNPTTGTDIDYSWAWYCLEIAVHPTNPNFVVTASVRPGYSTNGGSTWNDLDNSHSDYHAVRFFKGENNFLIGNDGGIHQYSASNPTTKALRLNNGYNVTQFYTGAYFPTGDNIAGGTQDNGTWTSFDNSSKFNYVLGGDGSYCAIHQQNGNTMYGSWQNGILRRASNAKNPTWMDIDNSLQASGDGFWFINPFDINPVDGDQIYFPTKKRIWRSTNQGSTWIATTNTIAGNLYAVGITSENNPTVYFGGQSSLLYRIDSAKTAKAGNEFMMTALAPTAARGGFIGNIEIDPVTPSTIYLSMNNISTNPRLWKVLNANTNNPTWINISGNLPAQLPVNWVEVDSKNTNLIIAATDFGLYTTTNGGQNWLKEQSIPNVHIPMIKLRDSDGQLFIFTHGRGVYTANTRKVPSVVDPSDKTVFKLYPNPLVDRLEIETAKAISKVEIYSVLGQKVFTASNKIIDLKSLASGQYLVQVTFADKSIETRKIIKN
jgi:photosystem II stability/assembly factor-like uncharacterized protein